MSRRTIIRPHPQPLHMGRPLVKLLKYEFYKTFSWDLDGCDGQPIWWVRSKVSLIETLRIDLHLDSLIIIISFGQMRCSGLTDIFCCYSDAIVKLSLLNPYSRRNCGLEISDPGAKQRRIALGKIRLGDSFGPKMPLFAHFIYTWRIRGVEYTFELQKGLRGGPERGNLRLRILTWPQFSSISFRRFTC